MNTCSPLLWMLHWWHWEVTKVEDSQFAPVFESLLFEFPEAYMQGRNQLIYLFLGGQNDCHLFYLATKIILALSKRF